MTEETIEAVAQLLAKVGGNWYPERTRPTLRTINKRHRAVAQLILVELDQRSGAGQTSATAGSAGPDNADEVNTFNFAADDQLYVGAAVVYRPPGEKRAITCFIEKMEHGRAYLVPAQQEIGWVPTQTLSRPKSETDGR